MVESHKKQDGTRAIASYVISSLWLLLGAFIAAFAIKIFFIPNALIDGGTVGLAMIAARAFGTPLLPLFLLCFNLPFIWLAYKHIGRTFVIQLVASMFSFALFLFLMPYIFSTPFVGDNIEVIAIGGAIMGIGIGLIIRKGGCLDGTEILGIIVNKKKGFTVGQAVFTCNIFVFGLAGLVFQDWHPPILSLITYFVVVKVMDMVIVGLDETKSVLVISSQSKEIASAVVHELGLGLTIMYGRGGYSGESTEILYIITERLQLSDLKELIYRIDPKAFMAIENLHEVSAGQGTKKVFRIKKQVNSTAQKVLQH